MARYARRKPLLDPPLFLRSETAAVAWLKTNNAIMEVFEGMFPPEYPEEDRASTLELELREIAWAYMEKAREIIDAGQVVIYRAIRIPQEGGLHNVNWDCLGKSWSVEYGSADVYGIAPYESGYYRDVVLVGEVKPQHIDWAYGFESFAIYGRDQWEISLLKNSPVLIREIRVRPSLYRWSATGHERRVLSKPILGSTGSAHEVWEETCQEVRGKRRALTPEEATLEGWRMEARLFDIFEVKGKAYLPVRLGVEATDALDAFVKADLTVVSLHGSCWRGANFITRIRETRTGPIKTLLATPATREVP